MTTSGHAQLNSSVISTAGKDQLLHPAGPSPAYIARLLAGPRPGVRFLRGRKSWTQVCNKYQITVRQIARLYEEQSGRCGICARTEDESTAFILDHNHGTGELRGLLCGGCNVGIAAVDRHGIDSVIAYITDPPARNQERNTWLADSRK